MPSIESEILQCTGATSIRNTAHVQTLWSGYGTIKRYTLEGGEHASVIAKHIQLPDTGNHPKGWNSDLSHQRKIKSYVVESYWYSHYAQLTNAHCKVPKLLHADTEEGRQVLIMEDLNASGFPIRLDPETVSLVAAKNCLSWLAHFHGKFMQVQPKGLWEIGTYWYLDTRPDELAKMKNKSLKQMASAIDRKLNEARFQTLVHGDAKVANFCFGPGNQVAAVDFQYVGKGCGIKDVAYFISSCFTEDACERFEEELLNHYFNVLETAMDKTIDFQSVKKEWSALYKYAWADLYRFLDGWSDGHWKMHGYSKSLTKSVLKELNNV
ncbi:phosphotransferase [Cyclobacterium qasimii]|uniref:Phosphotransferase n=2 Tax=Cyclobacterium qasimii TaxID=1350429 RepID=A0A512C7A1_9BACT|nr:phosphotransferase [Cyclobacterium qasimii]